MPCLACISAFLIVNMLLKITEYKNLNGRKLMDIYEEGNRENVAYFYPDCKNEAEGVKLVERDFLKYLETDFFNGKDTYYVLEENGEWLSALRLYSVGKATYYIEALETKPSERRKGHATMLLLLVLNELKEKGDFTVCSTVSKRNAASLSTHIKCGFSVETQIAQDYLSGESYDDCYGLAYKFCSSTK